MTTLALNGYSTIDNSFEPEWYRAERYDYCEQGLLEKKQTLLALITNFYKRLFHF